jgi:hypothetical protein
LRAAAASIRRRLDPEIVELSWSSPASRNSGDSYSKGRTHDWVSHRWATGTVAVGYSGGTEGYLGVPGVLNISISSSDPIIMIKSSISVIAILPIMKAAPINRRGASRQLRHCQVSRCSAGCAQVGVTVFDTASLHNAEPSTGAYARYFSDSVQPDSSPVPLVPKIMKHLSGTAKLLLFTNF